MGWQAGRDSRLEVEDYGPYVQSQPMHELHRQVSKAGCSMTVSLLTITCSSSLARIETSMIKALERQEATQKTVETAEEITPLTRAQTAPTVGASAKEVPEAEMEDDGPSLPRIQRAFTGATLVDPTEPTFDLTPPASEEDILEQEAPRATSSKQKLVRYARVRKVSTFDVNQEPKALPPSPQAFEEYANDVSKDKEVTSTGKRLIGSRPIVGKGNRHEPERDSWVISRRPCRS